MQSFIPLLARLRLPLLALVSGSLITLSLAPFNLWPLGPLAASLLALCLDGAANPWRQRFLLAFLFGLGMFGSGASWVYVAIHDFAYTPMLLALVMTAMFVSFLAAVFALPFLLYSPGFAATRLGQTFGFSALWVLGEWSRSWLLTGFPWLYLGYGHIDTWLSGWAPVFGVFGLSFFAVLSGTVIHRWLLEPLLKKTALARWHTAATLLGLALIWAGGFGLSGVIWDKNQRGGDISVAIIQPNIPLAERWDPLFQEQIVNVLLDEADQHWDKDLQVWPEAAIPMMYHEATEFMEEISILANENQTGVISGVLYDDLEKFETYYNGIVGLGLAEGLYFKQRLVPFGEYVPLENWLRGLIHFFDLPHSVLFPGPKNQEILSLKTEGQTDNKIHIAPSICYEIVYPDLVSQLARNSSLLITISNDAWFGDSIGPMQHFQMAQMRALENQRYVVRATNTGLSGVIDHKGKVVLLGRQFVRESLAADKVALSQSRTPFSHWQSWPVIALCGLITLLVVLGQGRRRQQLLVGMPG